MAHFYQTCRQFLLQLLIPAFSHMQLMSQIQCGHHGNAFGTVYLAGIPDFAHLSIQLPGGLDQALLFVGCAGDFVILAKYCDSDGGHVFFHAPCSIAFKRVIMASTRVLAKVVFSNNLAF